MVHERQVIAFAKILGCAVVLLIGWQLISSRTSNSSVAELESDKAFLESRVVEAQKEYQVAASTASELREQLDVIVAKLSRLNATNTHRRAELRIINRKLIALKDPGSQD